MIPLLITQDLPQWTPCDAVVQKAETIEWAREGQAAGLVVVHQDVQGSADQTLQWIEWADRSGAPRGTLQDLQGI